MKSRFDLDLPLPENRPLVSGAAPVERLNGTADRGQADRDEFILSLLRHKLKARSQGNTNVTSSENPAGSASLRESSGEEDKYEPQRISRKICWQYDNAAKRVPLLRRHYI